MVQWLACLLSYPATNARVQVRVSAGAWTFRLYYVAFSEACHHRFSLGTSVSSPPSSVNGSANKIKLK